MIRNDSIKCKSSLNAYQPRRNFEDDDVVEGSEQHLDYEFGSTSMVEATESNSIDDTRRMNSDSSLIEFDATSISNATCLSEYKHPPTLLSPHPSFDSDQRHSEKYKSSPSTSSSSENKSKPGGSISLSLKMINEDCSESTTGNEGQNVTIRQQSLAPIFSRTCYDTSKMSLSNLDHIGSDSHIDTNFIDDDDDGSTSSSSSTSAARPKCVTTLLEVLSQYDPMACKEDSDNARIDPRYVKERSPALHEVISVVGNDDINRETSKASVQGSKMQSTCKIGDFGNSKAEDFIPSESYSSYSNLDVDVKTRERSQSASTQITVPKTPNDRSKSMSHANLTKQTSPENENCVQERRWSRISLSMRTNFSPTDDVLKERPKKPDRNPSFEAPLTGLDFDKIALSTGETTTTTTTVAQSLPIKMEPNEYYEGKKKSTENVPLYCKSSISSKNDDCNSTSKQEFGRHMNKPKSDIGEETQVFSSPFMVNRMFKFPSDHTIVLDQQDVPHGKLDDVTTKEKANRTGQPSLKSTNSVVGAILEIPAGQPLQGDLIDTDDEKITKNKSRKTRQPNTKSGASGMVGAVLQFPLSQSSHQKIQQTSNDAEDNISKDGPEVFVPGRENTVPKGRKSQVVVTKTDIQQSSSDKRCGDDRLTRTFSFDARPYESPWIRKQSVSMPADNLLFTPHQRVDLKSGKSIEDEDLTEASENTPTRINHCGIISCQLQSSCGELSALGSLSQHQREHVEKKTSKKSNEVLRRSNSVDSVPTKFPWTAGKQMLKNSLNQSFITPHYQHQQRRASAHAVLGSPYNDVSTLGYSISPLDSNSFHSEDKDTFSFSQKRVESKSKDVIGTSMREENSNNSLSKHSSTGLRKSNTSQSSKQQQVSTTDLKDDISPSRKSGSLHRENSHTNRLSIEKNTVTVETTNARSVSKLVLPQGAQDFDSDKTLQSLHRRYSTGFLNSQPTSSRNAAGTIVLPQAHQDFLKDAQPKLMDDSSSHSSVQASTKINPVPVIATPQQLMSSIRKPITRDACVPVSPMIEGDKGTVNGLQLSGPPQPPQRSLSLLARQRSMATFVEMNFDSNQDIELGHTPDGILNLFLKHQRMDRRFILGLVIALSCSLLILGALGGSLITILSSWRKD